MTPNTIARTIIALVALVNAVMLMLGKAPLDLDENTIYVTVSGIATILTTLWVWWKNNSVTKEAIMADEMMHQLKDGRGDE